MLLYVKKKAGATQAKRVGDSWLSGILPGSRKSKAFIEVIANHSIGPKQSITIVRIKDQQFVLGVTSDSVQLITQLDSEEADLELLEDPKVADSIGKMFGAKVKSEIKSEPMVTPAMNFDSILKSSSGAGAIVARKAYRDQSGDGIVVPMQQSPVTTASRGSGIRSASAFSRARGVLSDATTQGRGLVPVSTGVSRSVHFRNTGACCQGCWSSRIFPAVHIDESGRFRIEP